MSRGIIGLALALAPALLWGEDWVRLGNSAIDFSLAGLGTGPVERVWYGSAGNRLLIRTQSGKVFETSDFETWKPSSEAAPPASNQGTARLPESTARVRNGASSAYAFGNFVYRSVDGGQSWENLTALKTAGGLRSLVGAQIRDLTVSPRSEEEVVVASSEGVFRSLDGGKSWAGLNDLLPNLPGGRFRSVPSSGQPLRLELSGARIVQWQAGEKVAWRPTDPTEAITDYQLRQAWTELWGALVTAVLRAGDTIYTGMVDGRISVSSDGGRTWQTFSSNASAPVEGFWVDPNDPRVAIAILGLRQAPLPGAPQTHVLRTLNAGTFWDDVTANLPDVQVTGVTADRASNSVYISSSAGVFAANLSLNTLAPAAQWTAITGLPSAQATDVGLDAAGNRLWVELEGLGAYSTLAPHRLRDPRVVSAADLLSRSAAPGALLSVLGSRVDSAQAGNLRVPVLDAKDTESQIQIPFDVRGDSVALSLISRTGTLTLPVLPLTPTSPAIFLNQDGSPAVLDAETGLMLDPMNPVHSNAHIQVLMTGLGRVRPDWPSGTAAPLDNPPSVIAPVKAWLDRAPVDVTRAVLAPGYVGVYLVELEIPKIVNYGPAELYLEAGGQISNRVRVYIEP